MVCVFESLLIWDCFQGATLEAKAVLCWLGRCKGTLHCRASVSAVREGCSVVWCGVCGVCVCVFADWALFLGCVILEGAWGIFCCVVCGTCCVVCD